MAHEILFFNISWAKHSDAKFNSIFSMAVNYYFPHFERIAKGMIDDDDDDDDDDDRDV